MNRSTIGNSGFMFTKNWGWLLAWGVLLEILGFTAISLSVFTTMATIVILGFVILAAGLVILIDSATFWWNQWREFFLHSLLGFFYVLAGLMLITNPIIGSFSITLLLGIFYLLIGMFRITYSLAMPVPRWGWGFFGGFISFLLGILILGNLSAASLYIIGLFIGIDLIFSGFTYMMIGLGAKNLR